MLPSLLLYQSYISCSIRDVAVAMVTRKSVNHMDMVDTTIVNVININTVRDIHTINMAATTKQHL